MMTRRTRGNQDNDAEDRQAETQARIESLEAAAADAEARAATALEELAGAREASASLELQLAEAKVARESAEDELLRSRSEAEETRSRLADAAVKYREARLASAPEVPQDLVPAAESLLEIDEAFEAAWRVVGQLRERIEDERLSARVPVGSPSRRVADLSSLSASEKIRLGLEQLSEREAR
jgi:chromosome segregation ATPase